MATLAVPLLMGNGERALEVRDVCLAFGCCSNPLALGVRDDRGAWAVRKNEIDIHCTYVILILL